MDKSGLVLCLTKDSSSPLKCPGTEDFTLSAPGSLASLCVCYFGVVRGLRICREETGHWETPFEFCKGKCRTTSRSTVHENAYLSPRHHCFSASGTPLSHTSSLACMSYHTAVFSVFNCCQNLQSSLSPHNKHTVTMEVENVRMLILDFCLPAGKPTVPSPPVPDIPLNVKFLVSREKQSCQERCSEDNLECLEAHFSSLNDCNRLRDRFACEAGCEAGTGLALPAYIIPKAAKSERPAMCLTYSPELSKEGMTCDSGDSNRQRACPCGSQ